MANDSYDRTNSGVFFPPHEDQDFMGQGKLDVEGRDMKIIAVFERLGRSGDRQVVLYQKLGVLWPHDKKDNDRAPDRSGKLDDYPDHRIAAWKGEKDGRKYMSLKVSRRDDRSSESGGYATDNAGWGGDRSRGDSGGGSSYPDDEIPF